MWIFSSFFPVLWQLTEYIWVVDKPRRFRMSSSTVFFWHFRDQTTKCLIKINEKLLLAAAHYRMDSLKSSTRTICSSRLVLLWKVKTISSNLHAAPSNNYQELTERLIINENNCWLKPESLFIECHLWEGVCGEHTHPQSFTWMTVNNTGSPAAPLPPSLPTSRPTTPEEKGGHTNTASDCLLICLKRPIQTGSSTERKSRFQGCRHGSRRVVWEGDQDAADDSADFQHTQLHRGARL